MTDQRRRDAIRAVRLGDGTYLIRSGCCQPQSCAPAAGIRCCFSARCECDWPKPTQVRTAPRRHVGIGIAAGAGVATLVLCGGLAWFVVANIVPVIATVATVLVLGLAYGLWAGRRPPRGGHTTTITVNNR